jgi:hypothetical protein
VALNAASVAMFTLPRLASEMGAHVGYVQGWAMATQYLWAAGQRVNWAGNYARGATEAWAEGKHFVKGFKPRENWMGRGRSVRRTFDSVEDNKQRVLAGGGQYAQGVVDMLEELRLRQGIGQAGLDQANLRDIMLEAETTLGAAGLKVARGVEQSSRIFRALLDGVETNNRAIPAIAYYEFYRHIGDTHEQAMAKAISNVSKEQVNYSKENWSPWMAKNPLVSAAILFKKFPLQAAQTYWDALLRAGVERDPHLAKVARFQVANMTLMLAVVGGFAGNPVWEPFKYLYALLSSLIGGPSYDELKSEGEKLMEQWIGGMPAEMVMYGAPRALGIDIANRVSLDTLAMLSLPKEDTWEGLAGVVGQMVMGAPGAAGYGMYKFARDWDSGDASTPKWLSNAPAPKFVKDIFKAYDLYENGPTTATGVSTGKPISAYEAGIQAAGFRPSSQSRPFEVGSALQYKAKQRLDAQRDATIRRVLNGGMTSSNMRAVQDWNRSHGGKGERISTRDLSRSQKRRRETEAEIRAGNQ